jgi:hypothetical protein
MIYLLTFAVQAFEESFNSSKIVNPISVLSASSGLGLAAIASVPHPFLAPETIACPTNDSSSAQNFDKAWHSL